MPNQVVSIQITFVQRTNLHTTKRVRTSCFGGLNRKNPNPPTIARRYFLRTIKILGCIRHKLACKQIKPFANEMKAKERSVIVHSQNK